MFFGTPEWAVPSLRRLLDSGVDVVAAVTNPDRPAGRGMKLRPPPVKAEAKARRIDVLQPESARSDEFAGRLRDLEPSVAVVVAYGKILPPGVLDIPSLGFVNLHFSILPRYRGAAPVQRAIMDGLGETGASVMVLTEGMDEGPLLGTAPVAIGPDDTAGTLGAKLADVGAGLLTDVLARYAGGEIEPVAQDDGLATYAPKITDAEARLDWSQPAGRLRDKVRALNPAPGAWTTLRGERVKLWRIELADRPVPLSPGELHAGDGLVAGTGDGCVAVVEAQMRARRKLPGAELARGLRLASGEGFS